MPVVARRLYDWHAAPGAFARLVPPWDSVELVSSSGESLADRVLELRMRLGPARLGWRAVHHDHVEGERFADRAERGPFATWNHEHVFQSEAAGSTLIDRVTWEPPLGALGLAVAGASIGSTLDRVFAFRHARTREDLLRHADIRPRTIAVTGASGLLGTQLVAFLGGGGHRVRPLVRRAPRTPDEIRWDPDAGSIDAAALEGVDAVVHLAGESVGDRWTPARRKAILESREKGTRLLAKALAGLSRRPEVLVSASAVGIYGDDRGDEELDETSTLGTGFLADVCRAWEAATAPASEAGIRVVHARLGVVLTPRGGALANLLPPARLGALGPVGSGRQYMSWVAPDDVLGALLHAIVSPELSGPLNVTSPRPVPQAELARTLGAVLHRPSFMPLPAFAVKLMFGEMGESVLLGGQRVQPSRLIASGYTFARPDLASALAFELGVPAPGPG